MSTVKDCIIIILAVLASYNTYLLHCLDTRLDDKVIALTDQIDSVRISTDGRLQELDASCRSLAKAGNTQVVTREVTYVRKDSANDADVEINSTRPTVSVSVNGSPKYSFDTLPYEKYKFDQGKLIISTASTSSIDITAKDYPRSPWTVAGLMNGNKKIAGTLSYDLGHSTSLTVMAGQEMKPYYGITFRIGSRK